MEKHELDEAVGAEEFVNRTGIMTNPDLSAELIEGAQQTKPSSDGDARSLAELRSQYLQEQLPIGSPPIVAEVSEDGEILGVLEGMTILLDKLGERLAFERQGTRLYEAVIQKCELLEAAESSGPSLEELHHICAGMLPLRHLARMSQGSCPKASWKLPLIRAPRSRKPCKHC
jgi:hypothetical protein